MWPVKPLNGMAAKLAAIYVGLFALSVAILGIVSVLMTDAALRRQVDSKISIEMKRLVLLQSTQGEAALVQDIASRATSEKGFSYRFENSGGVVLAGNFVAAPQQAGWFYANGETASEQEAADSFRGLTQAVSGGSLTIADDIDEIENTQNALTGVYLIAGLAAAILAVAGGFWLSRFYLSNVTQLADTAEAITGGDLTRRMPVLKLDDGFDRLSSTLNRMLDRNSELLDNQKQITSDIAHDIKTPLTRLRQKLERDGNHGALEETDHLLDILNSLLRIAEIEEGARREKFTRVDLSQITNHVIEAYAAPFEDSGHSLRLHNLGSVWIEGDRELLFQLVSNLAENVLAHTPQGTSAILSTTCGTGGTALSLEDDGPGVADDVLPHIFRRFYRGDSSRSLPGNGLGLALVRAIAELHGAKIEATNLKPGFRIALNWPKKKPG
jgi:signal transduction histidine kinase